MRLWSMLLTALLPMLFSILSASAPPTAPKEKGTKIRYNHPETATAIVEQVFLVVDEDFSGITYQITWKGQKAIVEDPIHETNYKVGDKMAFLVMKHDMSSKREPRGRKLLNLHALSHVPAPAPE